MTGGQWLVLLIVLIVCASGVINKWLDGRGR